MSWLTAEMDGELLEVLHRYRARTKGHPPEHPAQDLDLDDLEEFHLAAFDDLFEGARSDEYLLGGRRYWTCIYVCPSADCDCHQLRVGFFDDEVGPNPSDGVGAVLLHLGDAEGFELVEMEAEPGTPGPLLGELWAAFERRHRVGPFLRRREAQAKAVGATLWHPVAKPVRAVPQPGRNDPCPCRSGAKFKKCCLGKQPPKLAP